MANEWVEFAGTCLKVVFFFNVRTHERLSSFPQLAERHVHQHRKAHDHAESASGAAKEVGKAAEPLRPMSLPPRKLEPSAEMLADIGAAQFEGLKGNSQEREREVRDKIWEPRIAARAMHVAHQPCPLMLLVDMGRVLGVDAARSPQLMWLADAALTPELPAGWVEHVPDDGPPYYWNPVCNVAQWEHPYVSYLTGVARQLAPVRKVVTSKILSTPRASSTMRVLSPSSPRESPTHGG